MALPDLRLGRAKVFQAGPAGSHPQKSSTTNHPPDIPPPLVLKCRLTKRDQGTTLLVLLSRRFPYHDEGCWRGLLRRGLVTLNGRRVAAEHPVAAGDELAYLAEDIQEPEIPARFELVLETADLLLVGKAAGTPVTRTGLIVRQTLVNILRRHFRQEIHPLHRPVLIQEKQGSIEAPVFV